MTKSRHGAFFSAGAVAGICIGAILVVLGTQVYAAVTSKGTNQRAGEYNFVTLLNGTTTSATSTNDTGTNGLGYAVLTGAKKVTAFFERTATTSTNSGTSRFSIQVTPDGSNWYDYKDLRITSTEVFTADANNKRVASSTQAATSTVTAVMDSMGFYGARCVVVEATDGQHTCKLFIEY